MVITGIVVEYNPLHNGHVHHINEARRLTNCDVLIAVMSGNFVQRGEPAIIDKFTRTKMALLNNVDIIIEIPFPFVNQNADVFAKAAVELLAIAKCDYIVFGSETNNIDELYEFAELPININNLKELMNTGISYPKAYGLLAKGFYPNDILGIAYLKALKNYQITPLTIQRTNHYHDTEVDSNIVSASAIRQHFLAGDEINQLMPNADLLKQTETVTIEQLYPLIRTILLTQDSTQLAKMCLFSEGIENHLRRTAETSYDYSDFINKSITRRYTKSRIQRTLIAMLTQTTQAEVDSLPTIDRLKILGFNEIGQTYLKILKQNKVKVVTKFKEIHYLFRQIDLRANAVYTTALSSASKQKIYLREFRGPIIRKNDEFINE